MIRCSKRFLGHCPRLRDKPTGRAAAELHAQRCTLTGRLALRQRASRCIAPKRRRAANGPKARRAPMRVHLCGELNGAADYTCESFVRCGVEGICLGLSRQIRSRPGFAQASAKRTLVPLARIHISAPLPSISHLMNSCAAGGRKHKCSRVCFTGRMHTVTCSDTLCNDARRRGVVQI